MIKNHGLYVHLNYNKAKFIKINNLLKLDCLIKKFNIICNNMDIVNI